MIAARDPSFVAPEHNFSSNYLFEPAGQSESAIVVRSDGVPRDVGAFPDGQSALMLVAARLRHIASTKWGKRRYMVMDLLLNPAKQEDAALLPGLQPVRPPRGFQMIERTG